MDHRDDDATISGCMFGPHHCFNSSSSVAISSYLYLLSSVFGVWISIQRSSGMKEYGHATFLQPVRRLTWFPSLLTFSFLFRAAWFILLDMHAMETWNGSTYKHVMWHVPLLSHEVDMYPLFVIFSGKLATLLYFSAFTVLLRSWDEVLCVHSTWKSSTESSSTSTSNSTWKQRLFIQSRALFHQRGTSSTTRSKVLFVIANVWMYLIESTIVFVRTVFPTSTILSKYIESDSIVVAMFFLALAIGIASCGLKLRRLFRRMEFSTLASVLEVRLLALTLVFSLVFFSRGILFVLSDSNTNPWIVFTVPELVPGLSVLAMMRVVKYHSLRSMMNNISSSTTTTVVENNDDNTSDEILRPLLEKDHNTSSTSLLPLSRKGSYLFSLGSSSYDKMLRNENDDPSSAPLNVV